MMRNLSAIMACVAALPALAMEYPYTPYNEGRMDPQKTGWPLMEAELAWVAKGEYINRNNLYVGQWSGQDGATVTGGNVQFDGSRRGCC